MRPTIARRLVAALVVVIAGSTSAKADLINGGFETPVFGPASVNFPASIPGWATNDSTFEIWTSGFNGVPAYEGNQFAELNSNFPSTIHQDVTGIGAGSLIDFSFAHRGRAGVDTMRFTITDLGADGAAGGAGINADTVLFTNTYMDGTSAWGFYTGTSAAALGNTVRFSYEAVGSGSVGNFLDAASFAVAVPAPPVVVVALIVGASGMGFGGLRRRRAA